MKPRNKRSPWKISLLIILFATFLFMQDIRPVFAEIPVVDAQETGLHIKDILEKIKDVALEVAGTAALQQAAANFINRLAQQTADYLVSGGAGKSSLQRRQTFGSIVRQAGEAAVGDFIQDFSNKSGLTKLGLNICNPTAQLKASLSLQLLGNENPLPPSNCTVSDIKQNWQQFAQNYADPSNFGANVSFGNQFGVSGSIGGASGGTVGTCKAKPGYCSAVGSASTGSCTPPPNTSVGPYTPRTCSSDFDCAGLGLGWTCVQAPQQKGKSCSADTECPSGLLCIIDKANEGKSCLKDSDCGDATKYTCAGGNAAAGGIPLIGLTANKSVQDAMSFLNDWFSPEQSDLGASISFNQKLAENKEFSTKYAALNAEACKGYRDSPAKIANSQERGYVLRTCDEIEQLNNKQTGPGSATASDVVNNEFSLSSKSFWTSVAKTFAKSLVSGLLKKYIKAGSFSVAQLGDQTDLNQVRQNIVQKLRGGSINPLDLIAQQVTNSLGDSQKATLTDVASYDYLSNLSICPDDRNTVELDNCSLDDNFANAIREQMTLREALDKGQINPGSPLVSNLDVSLNSDPFCIRSGLCYSNIVRLRKYRIIPVGWEIAASLSPIDNPITIGEAVDCFDNGGRCKLDAASNIYYHLIDPGWVLKAPAVQCKAQVYGPKLLSVDSDERQKYCANTVSCLGEDDQGNCIGGYGYCTQEKNIWRFDGNQCPKQYASCGVYTRTVDNVTSSFLTNSLNICDASQNGCLWYSKSQDNIGTVDNPVYAWNPNDRIYFNNKVKECDNQDLGCSEYIAPTVSGVNLVPNGDFDYFTAASGTDFSNPNWLNDATPDTFDGWQGTARVYTTHDNAFYGTVGMKAEKDPVINSGRISTNVITGILADKTFTLSWYAKVGGIGAGAPPSTCTADVSVASENAAALNSTVTYTNAWKLYEMPISFGANDVDTLVNISLNADCQSGGTAYPIYLDGVKFELNGHTSGFTAYGDKGKTYIKAQNSCTKDDVGCQLFSPTAGGFAIPGRVNSNDSCPSECVGYQNYLELASNFDVIEAGSTPVNPRSANFIANTGKSCPVNAVDCEEFTNLEEVAQGGEGKDYFKYIRQCVDDPLGQTYYTLEGSDTTGFQVHTWRLLPSTIIDPVTGVGNGPCTHVNPGGTACQDSIANTLGITTCTAAETNTNLDCREFFDLNGRSHFFLQSRVIFASTECTRLRRSTTGVIFNGLPELSSSCTAEQNGCREYRGSQGNNLRSIFSDSFETGITPWDTTTVSQSNESVSNVGHSLTNTTAAGGFSGTIKRFAAGSTNGAITIRDGHEYYLDFWMKTTAANQTVTVSFAGVPGVSFAPLSVPVATPWQVYRLGPLYISNPANGGASTGLNIAFSSATQVYIDNIVLQESLSNIFVIKDSWKTPRSCDTPIPGAMLGCQAYSGTDGNNYNLRSFSRLCSEEVLGCQAFIDTHNSTDPFQRIFNQNDPSEVLVSADSLTYKVFNDRNLCSAPVKGCSALGAPDFNVDVPETDPHYISGYAVKNLLNNPDTYDSILCTDDGLFCQEYTNSAGAPVYFKDPRDRVCVYKENVGVNGQYFSGWFQTKSLDSGSPKGCSDDGLAPLEQGDFQLHTNTDAHFNGWAGQCPTQYDRCTEFQEPTDTQGDNLAVDGDFHNGEANWTPVITAPNTLTDLAHASPPNLADVFDVSTTAGYAITRADPYGGIGINRPYVGASFNSNVTYAYSVEANIVDAPPFPPDPAPKVQVALKCQWDSGQDTDYCATAAGVIDYTQACTVDNDCTGGRKCQRYSTKYCENVGAGDQTSRICNVNSDCTTLGTGYTCVANNPANRGLVVRDQEIIYTASGDTTLADNWQVIRGTVDFASDGAHKELLNCELQLNQSRGDTSVPPKSYCIDPNTNATNKALCTSNANCTVGTFTQCGGRSEIWWRNPTIQQVKSYYYLNDDTIDTQSCAGKVGKQDGCILFLDGNNRQTKLYNAATTYALSKANNGADVSPTACATADCQNDTNIIIKVKRDRQCSQWLSCKSATEVFDPSTNSYRQVCDQVGVCDEYTPGSEVLSCAHWTKPSTQRLEYGYYINRATDFEAPDYTGYSVYNMYNVGTMDLVDVSSTGGTSPTADIKNPDFRLVRVIDSCDSTINYDEPCGPPDPFDTTDKLGRCFSPNKCAVGIDGSHFSRDSDFVIKQSTRAWAEKNSPFPHSVIESESGDSRQVKFGFQTAKICDSRLQSCETRYYKFTYGATGTITRYYSGDANLGGSSVAACLCQGGLRDNQECLTDDTGGAKGCSNNLTKTCDKDGDCGKGELCVETGDGKLSSEERCPNNGSPVFLRQANSYLNWPGYCLEPDTRAQVNGSQTENACLNWFPVDNTPSGYDFFSQNRVAGYTYKTPAYYCLDSFVAEVRRSFSKGCVCAAGSGGKLECNSDDMIKNDQKDYHTVGIYEPKYCDTKCSTGDGSKKVHCYVVPNGIKGVGNGVFSYDGDTSYKESPPVAFCKVLGKAVDDSGANAAMTNRFWSGSNGGAGYEVGTENPPLGYKLNQDDTPFGSAVPTGFGFVVDMLYIKNSKEVPRAGSPYACSSTTESCASIDEDSGTGAAIKGWKKDPPYVGQEAYTVGLTRLKEIYKKVYGLYAWSESESCSSYNCGGTKLNTDDSYSPEANGEGSIFGGQLCDPSQTNACNASGGATCTPINDVCVNSLFNSGSASDIFFNACATCPVGFHPENSLSRRCESDKLSTDTAACGTDDFDPGPPVVNCSTLSGYSCQIDPAGDGTKARCYSPDHEGNNCKIPSNPDGTLNANLLSCNAQSNGASTCVYGPGHCTNAPTQSCAQDSDCASPGTCGANTGVACKTTTDCTSKLPDNLPDDDESNVQGILWAQNQFSYCADSFTEGPNDYGAGNYCTGDPFTEGSSYIFNGTPQRCDSGITLINELGMTLSGSEICSSKGQCLPSYKVRRDAVPPALGTLMCVKLPDKGYLPIYTGKPVDQIKSQQLWSFVGENYSVVPGMSPPLDETASTTGVFSATYSPYMIPVKCDASGLNCGPITNIAAPQSTKLSDFRVPTDNGFSINNIIPTPPSISIVEGFQNMLASLRFYMAADKQHMPIRYIEVDWGDGSRQARQGYYKNHLASCNPTTTGPRTAQQSPLEFAGSPDGCREAFRNYLHVYTYDAGHSCGVCKATSPSPNAVCGQDSDCGAGFATGDCDRTNGDSASCYFPKVMLQDNWGWCTNDVYGETGSGCRDTQVVRYCTGGAANPQLANKYRCTADADCSIPSGVKQCDGGRNDGQTCSTVADCPGQKKCQGGTRDGKTCTAAGDCPGLGGQCAGPQCNITNTLTDIGPCGPAVRPPSPTTTDDAYVKFRSGYIKVWRDAQQ